MNKHGAVLPRWLLVPLSSSIGGCAPVVDVAGVYIPGWLVSLASGVAVAYLVISLLSRGSVTKDLADSGLFFLGLVTIFALSVWWLFFRGF